MNVYASILYERLCMNVYAVRRVGQFCSHVKFTLYSPIVMVRQRIEIIMSKLDAEVYFIVEVCTGWPKRNMACKHTTNRH